MGEGRAHFWPPFADDTIDAGTVLEGAPRKDSSGCDGRSACGVGVDVLEDGGDHTRVGDHRQHAQCCAAARAAADVNLEYPA